jgi:hypothetical protein
MNLANGAQSHDYCKGMSSSEKMIAPKAPEKPKEPVFSFDSSDSSDTSGTMDL